MLDKIYKKYVPKSIRKVVYRSFLRDLFSLRRDFKLTVKAKCSLWFGFLLPKSPENKLYALMGRYGIQPLPYKFTVKYRDLEVEKGFDEKTKLFYVVHKNKKLFFPENLIPEKVEQLYKGILMEQDIESPHRYVESYSELKGKTLLDIGSAEAIFTLDVIDLVDHAYLFECEDYWQEALRATFAPYSDKVTIVNKFVNDKNDGQNTTIDEFMKDKSIDNLFIKMDIEGSEMAALRGAKQVIDSGKNLQLAVCTYHKDEDASEISNYFGENGIDYTQTDGYLFFENKFRKAVIRGKKDN